MERETDKQTKKKRNKYKEKKATIKRLQDVAKCDAIDLVVELKDK